jgi:complement component 1 Q subcomponent-binding protein, mitochondrial
MNFIILRNAAIRHGIARRSLSTASLYIKSTTCQTTSCYADTVHQATSTSPYGSRRFLSSMTASDALIDLLNREHTEEVENNSTAMPENIKDLHHLLTEEKGWKISTDDDTAMTKLYKTVDAVKVQVCFHCQDATERMADEVDENIGEDDIQHQDDEQQEEAASVRFTVSSTKAGKTLFLVCIAEDSMVRIQNISMAGTVQDIDGLHATGVNPSLYQGPEFTELAEDLQDAFHAYLEDYLGINSDVAAYIIMQFDYKEQCQYVKFLEETKSLLA